MGFFNRRIYTLQQKPAVALIVPFEIGSKIPAVVNTAKFFAKQGYHVDFFTISRGRFCPQTFDESDENSIKIHLLETSFTQFLFTRRCFKRIARVIRKEHSSPTIQSSNISLSSPRFIQSNQYAKLLTVFMLSQPFGIFVRGIIAVIKFFSPPHRYAFMIGFRTEGLTVTKLLNLVWRIPYIYHPLEIFEYSPNALFLEKLQKLVEIWFSQKATVCLSEDAKRCDLVAQENRIPREDVLVVYNSPLGDTVFPEKEAYLRQRFGIEENHYIVLAIGTLSPEHCIDQLVSSVKYWPEEFVLVLHGWIARIESFLHRALDKYPGRIFLSTDMLDGSQKYKIFQSADIGFVGFHPVNKNFRFAAGSAGKLYDFLRTGVPIIANDIPGMRELVERPQCGIVVESIHDIGNVLPDIIAQYDVFRQNALTSYHQYEFGTCYANVLEQVKQRIMN